MAQHHDSHHDHGHGAHDHGTMGTLIKGFVLSVILTVIPFWLVMGDVLESRNLTIALVIGLAAVQIIVHMVYFLHMSSSAEEGWTLISTVFTVIVVVIMLSGSVWVMYHMNQNMMPQHDMETMGIPQ